MTDSAVEGRLQGPRDTGLHWKMWMASQPRASILLVHGLGEHSGRYDAFSRDMAGRGISVFAFDLRGHGRSEGRRGDVDAFPRFLEDLVVMEGEMLQRLPPGTPSFLMGHSLGGLIAIRRLQVSRGPYRGGILSAPWLQTALPSWIRGVGVFLGMAMPGLSIPNGLGPGRLTRDPERQTAWRKDPLIHTRITGRLFREAERVQKEVLRSVGGLRPPLLFLVPGEDAVTRSEVTVEFAQKIVGDGIALEILEGRRHEPLQDVGRGEVYEMIGSWVLDQVSVPPGGS